MKLNLFLSSVVSERVAALAVTLSTMVFWLVILTFPDFFFFNPLANVDQIFMIEQLLSTTGWVLMGIVPLVFAWKPRISNRSTEPLFVFGAVLWPISVFVIQLTLLLQGSGFYTYLGNYPILIFTDIINCLFLLLIRFKVFQNKK